MKNNIDFFSDLSDVSKKKRYQGYLAELGIEKISVAIPVEHAKDFQILAEETKPQSKRELIDLVKKFDGFLDEA